MYIPLSEEMLLEEKLCKQKPGMGLRQLQMFVHSEHIEDKELPQMVKCFIVKLQSSKFSLNSSKNQVFNIEYEFS